MKVLSIGTDKNMDLFKDGSAVALRNISYGRKLGSVYIIVFGLKSSGFSEKKLSDEVTVYSTQSASRWAYVFDAIRLGKKIVAGDLEEAPTLQSGSRPKRRLGR